MTIAVKPRKLEGSWKLEYAEDWFRDPNDPYDKAFDNFFHDWTMNDLKTTGPRPDWGPEVWEPWGFTVEESKIKIIDERKFSFFLLRWS